MHLLNQNGGYMAWMWFFNVLHYTVYLKYLIIKSKNKIFRVNHVFLGYSIISDVSEKTGPPSGQIDNRPPCGFKMDSGPQ